MYQLDNPTDGQDERLEKIVESIVTAIGRKMSALSDGPVTQVFGGGAM